VTPPLPQPGTARGRLSARRSPQGRDSRQPSSSIVGGGSRVRRLPGPPTKTALTKAAYRLLRERVVGGELEAGERLQPDVLADEFGISRTPVRDALNQLAGEGLVEIHPRRGTFVARVDQQTVAELYQLRLMIDTFAAEALVPVITPRQKRHLASLLQRMAQQVEGDGYRSYTGYLNADRAFHLGIVELVGNHHLSAFYEEIILPLWLVRAQQEAGLAQDRDAATSLEHHQRILRTLQSGDREAARASVLAHLDFGRRRLDAWLSAPTGREGQST